SEPSTCSRPLAPAGSRKVHIVSASGAERLPPQAVAAPTARAADVPARKRRRVVDNDADIVVSSREPPRQLLSGGSRGSGCDRSGGLRSDQSGQDRSLRVQRLAELHDIDFLGGVAVAHGQ